ncbi:hypothetical protein, partial [Bradyrhizobium aeschynomenes]|uniref:hypothetical protein n=1 Tax=Bradyrhizobium aeschynomenes TaxID=2734909 RepID=UPI001AEECDA9
EGEGVQRPDAYGATVKGKIKAARRLNGKPLTWRAFNRAGRSVGVPLRRVLSAKSKTISALIVL